jgi:hypothetical protein
MFDDNFELTESTFILYAAKFYENRGCFDEVEFYDDLKRFKYIKRLFNRYKESGKLKERLILNHIIVLYNVFGPHAATKMLFFKFEEYYSVLKPFLVLLNFLPISLQLNGRTIRCNEIPLDQGVVDVLRNI